MKKLKEELITLKKSISEKIEIKNQQTNSNEVSQQSDRIYNATRYTIIHPSKKTEQNEKPSSVIL